MFCDEPLNDKEIEYRSKIIQKENEKEKRKKWKNNTISLVSNKESRRSIGSKNDNRYNNGNYIYRNISISKQKEPGLNPGF